MLITILVGVAIAIGLVGIVVPILPGILLVLGAILTWAAVEGTATSWTIFAIAAGLLAVGSVVKYTIPGKNLKASGVPNSTLLLGGLLGIIGFFVVPVVGLFIGFVLGVYLAEYRRVGAAASWPSTKGALKAVGLSIAIELVAALLATATWVVGLFLV